MNLVFIKNEIAELSLNLVFPKDKIQPNFEKTIQRLTLLKIVGLSGL
jgi:hypothetical protein